MKRISSLPALAVVAVVALVLGSFGTAVARPALTKGKVKAIATKVVSKKAGSLSVANATNLNALPASAYQTSTYNYVLPSGGTPVVSRNFSFGGLPAGTWLASYAVEGAMAAAGQSLQCWFLIGSGSQLVGLSYGGTFGAFSTATATTSLTVGSGQPVRLRCINGSSANWAVYDQALVASTVTFVKIDTQTSGSTTLATPSSSAGEPGAVTAR